MTKGICSKATVAFLMLQGLISLLGPGAQALEMRSGDNQEPEPITGPSHPHRLHPFQRSPKAHPSSADFLDRESRSGWEAGSLTGVNAI